MKGLLVKDCLLLFQRKQTVIIFILVCLMTGFTIDGSFIVGYMAFLSAIIALSTISYDDADNGMPFLMTLPVSRNTYALSKYVIGGIFAFCGWVLSLVLITAINAVKNIPFDLAENLVNASVFLLMSILVLDLMIPLQFKFGAEKSRIVMLIIFGGIAAVIAPLFVKGGIISSAALAAAADQVADVWYAVGGVLLCALLTAVSVGTSIRIMKKKVF